MTYLIPPSPIQIPRLKKPPKPGITPINHRSLILAKQILPKPSPLGIPLHITHLPQPARYLRNRKVVIRILQRPRDTPCYRPEAQVVEVFHGDVVAGFPACEPAAAFVGPVEGFLLRVFLDGGVAGFPVDVVFEAFDVGVCEDYVGVGAALGKALVYEYLAIQ